MNKNISRTHNIFFDYLTCKKVNELLKRADKGYNLRESATVIEEDIQPLLPSPFTVKTRVQVDLENQCNIYIIFFEGEYSFEEKHRIGHITLHLSKDNIQRRKNIFKMNPAQTNTPGRLHLGNNRSKTLRSHVIHVENEKNKIKLEVRHRPSVIENKLKICADIAINVLTEYFNPSSILFLGNSRTLSGYHKYVKKIITNLKTPIPLRSTRKIHQTKGNICTIINTI